MGRWGGRAGALRAPTPPPASGDPTRLLSVQEALQTTPRQKRLEGTLPRGARLQHDDITNALARSEREIDTWAVLGLTPRRSLFCDGPVHDLREMLFFVRGRV